MRRMFLLAIHNHPSARRLLSGCTDEADCGLHAALAAETLERSLGRPVEFPAEVRQRGGEIEFVTCASTGASA